MERTKNEPTQNSNAKNGLHTRHFVNHEDAKFKQTKIESTFHLYPNNEKL